MRQRGREREREGVHRKSKAERKGQIYADRQRGREADRQAEVQGNI